MASKAGSLSVKATLKFFQSGQMELVQSGLNRHPKLVSLTRSRSTSSGRWSPSLSTSSRNALGYDWKLVRRWFAFEQYYITPAVSSDKVAGFILDLLRFMEVIRRHSSRGYTCNENTYARYKVLFLVVGILLKLWRFSRILLPMDDRCCAASREPE